MFKMLNELQVRVCVWVIDKVLGQDGWILAKFLFCIIFLPSCIVFSDSTVLLGPSPTEVNANTSNSYSVYSSSPATTFVRVNPPLIVI